MGYRKKQNKTKQNKRLPPRQDMASCAGGGGHLYFRLDVILVKGLSFFRYEKNHNTRRGKLGNGAHLISSKSGKEGTMKIVCDNYCSFIRLWCVVIWEIYLNFVVKISKKKKQVNGFVYFSVHVTLIEQRMKIRSRADVKYSCK